MTDLATMENPKLLGTEPIMARIDADTEKVHLSGLAANGDAYYAIKSIPVARRAKGDWVLPLTYETMISLKDSLHKHGFRYEFDPHDDVLKIPDEGRAHWAKDWLCEPEEITPISIDGYKPKTKPWLHQQRGFHWALHKRRAMLAMDMGTGKSKVIIDLVCHLGRTENLKRVLIVCPKTVGTVWQDQFRMHSWFPHLTPALLINGTLKKRVRELRLLDIIMGEGAIVAAIINYDAIHHGRMAELVASIKWDMIVCDESHRIKAPNGVAARFVTKLKSKRRYCLTGTPIPHSPVDVYAQYKFLDPAIFGTSVDRFRAAYGGSQDEFGGIKYWRNKALAEQMNRLSFSVKADHVLKLPDAIHSRLHVELEAPAIKLYDTLESLTVADLGGDETISAPMILVKILRLQQIASGWAQSDENGPLHRVSWAKESAMEDYISGIDSGEAIVVFARFRPDLEVIRGVAERLGRPCYELSGKNNELKKWQDDDGPKGAVLATQIRSGGVGIDLTKAHYAIYYSLGYSLGEYVQSLARLRRPGQHHTVFYQHIIAAGTIDSEIYEALEARGDVVKMIEKFLLGERGK